MNAWIAIVIGSAVGLLWRRYTVTQQAGALTDMLLGTTGAFAARWLIDVFGQFGISTGRLNVVFAICGAGLLLWCFRGFDFKEHQIPAPRDSVILPPTQPTAELKPDSPDTTARAA